MYQRLLAGGRKVTIDGNTLDPTLHLMPAAQRRTGTGGLSAVDHWQFDALTHGFASTAPFGGGSADAVAATISAIRAHLSRD